MQEVEFIRLLFWGGIGSTAAAVFLILFMLILAGKEGRAIMGARLKAKPLLLVIRKTGNFVLTSGTNLGHAIKSKGGNIYISSPDAMRSLGNLRIGLAYEKSSIIVPPDIAAAMGKLEDEGIQNIDDLEALEPDYTAAKEQLGEEISKLKTAEQPIPEEMQKEFDRTQKVVDSVHKIVNFLKYNANPTYIGEAIQQLVSIQLDEDRKSTLVKWGGIAIAFFIIAIGFYIILTKLGTGCPRCADCTAIYAAARNVAQNTTVIQRSML